MTRVATTPQLSDFFLRLSDDPRLLVEYEQDPTRTMAAAGLTSEQISTVLEGGAALVRTTVDAEVAASPARRRLIVTPRMVIMTEPDTEPKPEPKPKPKPKPKYVEVA